MRTFTIYDVYSGNSWQIQADFMTVSSIGGEKHFWIKPRWWSRRRRVGLVNGAQYRVTTSVEHENDAQIAKYLGVKL